MRGSVVVEDSDAGPAGGILPAGFLVVAGQWAYCISFKQNSLKMCPSPFTS